MFITRVCAQSCSFYYAAEHGSVTADEISRHSGLTTGAVTGLIDRLQKTVSAYTPAELDLIARFLDQALSAREAAIQDIENKRRPAFLPSLRRSK